MKGKIIFITGASTGIGEGCARKFASEGADLVGTNFSVVRFGGDKQIY